MGGDSMYYGTTVSQSVALGKNAGAGDTGNNNIGIGFGAMNKDGASGDNNVAIGVATGDALTTGYSNVMVGTNVGTTMTTAFYNVALGDSAGQAMDNAVGNVVLGYKAGGSINSGGTNVCIGYQAGQDTVALTSGDNNVLIGTNVRTANANNVNNICIGHDIDSGNNEFAFGKASNKVFNNFDTDADWDRSSDVRKKRNINDAKLGLDFVNDLRPVTFQWRPNYDFPKDFDEYSEKNNMNTEVVMHGMIAQEVKEALDKTDVERFGGWKEDKHGSQYLSKEAFVIPLIKAVQELSEQNKVLEKRIEELEN